MSTYLNDHLSLHNTKKIFLPKAWTILRRFGLIAIFEMLFLISIVAEEASATQISAINPSPSTCIKGKDACVQKISNDTVTDKDEVDIFLRIEPSAGSSSQQGYNTDALLGKSLNTEKVSHSLKLSDVPIVNIGGTDYREFILRINEPVITNNSQDLSKIVLEKLEIFLGNNPDLANYPTFDGNATKIFDIEQNSVLLQDINSDNTSYDYFVYIKDSLFSSKAKEQEAQKYVYLFSQFTNAEGGVEEWAVRKDDKKAIIPPIIPDGKGGGGGGTGEILLGSVIAGLGLPQIMGGGKATSSSYISLPTVSGNSVLQDIAVSQSEAPTPDAPNPSDVPEPTTLLASLMGLGLIVKARSISRDRKIKK
ncbi:MULTISPECIES: hypothetical protein [unclassified Tolypothrix]|uniref:hypothetical protein n=1 Tax=unclassified Tolypothrix TaxID=2649714 RepID=UPI0005EAAFC4|nr:MULTISPECIES: hypothetical protein [unclassified Tolypothrix]BAY93619.1 hypothetical protein NIES3275_56600 [Microchaete diplosiphon NIES-3275]EKE99587.1 PEP-CTERM putative exosortase interaction domain protein [Tolypothrix sp. PCC 7601]MBE9081674.1 hypothetical protein [Tolypothrix sp. LEGE 11397]UYD27442.1 hypothetical protein HGR01_04955 [Tolypothrix sp. PCC 7712]UYD36693.1 hypothetical protein HG267_13755 [Tolypothrix sp. PCC 7601]